MAQGRLWVCGLVLVVACSSLWAVPPLVIPVSPQGDAQINAATLDRLIAAPLAAEGVVPAGRADDAEFLRRVYLDLTGRIPSVAQVRRFLADPAADKRARLIDQLLDQATYVQHFTNIWRAVLLPDNVAVSGNANLRPAFETWLRKQLADNAPYDQMVRDIIRPAGPRAFYQAQENKAENLAAATSRLFLGIKLECAQCHSHPFARWSREQFWSLAAFFSDLPQPRQPGKATLAPPRDGRQIKIPGTDKVVRARFLDGTEPAWTDGMSSRVTLAAWVTGPDNPYFARAAVNRLWSYFFGTGLVEPVDDLGEQNPASHPELLDQLARQFAAHRFDLKFLIRAITNSDTYQRTSRVTNPAQEDPRRFARMALRGLTPEQLYDSLAQATGYREPTGSDQGRRGGLQRRSEFLTKFADPGGKSTEFRLSILQALSLMNGKLVANATDLEDSEFLVAVLDAPFMNMAGRRVETLYLATLSRPPRPDEAERLVKYVDECATERSSRKALADLLWALLNSGEFILNH
jgi:hypothetical protein